MGIQARLAKKIRSDFLLEGGMGISGGSHSSRIFLGGTWEIYPDFMRQPSFSLRGRIINAKEFGIRHNKISIAPSLGKAFSIKGWVFHPYLSVPYSISLAGDRTYETSLNATAGIVGNLPIRRYRHLIGGFEAMAGLNGGFVGFFAGLSWPIE